MRWWENFIPFHDIPFKPGEIAERFGENFDIEKVAGEINWSSYPPGYAAYLMTRKSASFPDRDSSVNDALLPS